ncbi:MAG TPA: Gfo/Idh/MocA family oxidoreductase [Acidimicrobiia bacterium]
MIRIGLAGCGFIGTIHSFVLRQLGDAGLVDARVTGTFDPDPARAEAIAAHHGARAYSDLGALLDACDVAWVCTWTAAHREVVEAAAERGLPVFCEKPLAPTLPECEAVAAALERVPHQVGLVLRHAPVFEAIAGTVASGRYGAPMAAILRDDQYFPVQGIYASEWRSDVARAGGGTLIEHSIHDVDVLRWILGDPADVTARTGSRFGYPGIDDIATLTFSYANAGIATIVSVWHQILTRGSTRRLEVFCEEALLWTDDDYLGPLHVETSAGAETVDLPAPPWLERLDVPAALAKPLGQYATPTKDFLQTLAAGGGRCGSPSAVEALAAHRLVDLAYRSARAGGAPLAVA